MIPTKVTILVIDLNPQEIINQEITRITTSNQKDIQQAIDEQTKVAAVVTKKQQQENEIDALMQSLSQELTGGELGVDAILASIEGKINGMSAFTLRMKNYLKQRGNKYIMETVGTGKNRRYRLTMFNQN